MPKADSVSLPHDLAEEIRSHHVPKRAASVEDYVVFWARTGCLIDRALAATRDPSILISTLKAAILDAQRREA